jgi:parallel beta-helix repeat protein
MFRKAGKLRRTASSILIALLFLSLSVFAFTVQPAKAQLVTITINPDGSVTPSTANITTSDNVTYTFTGNNYLPIVVNRSNIIINGRGYTLQAFGETAFYLLGLSNVTITNTTITSSNYGIELESSSGIVLSGNKVIENNIGIYIHNSSDNVLSANTATENFYEGIDLYDYSHNNVLSGNNVTANSDYGILLYYSSGNRIFHNDFLNNAQQVAVLSSNNTWDDGYPSGGNYWSNYRTTYPNAAEIDSSGIWNKSYVINAQNNDSYPLMGPFHTFDVGTWGGIAYSVDTVSNSTITNLSFNQPAKTLTFNVTGPSGTMGFCRVAIPLSLMSGVWTVTVNGAPVSYSTATDANYTYIYFTYHHSTETVQIISTSVIPEFQPSMLLPLFMIITLIGAIILKRKRKVRN